MATDERDTEQNAQAEVLSSDVADKKKSSKFQPFKKFFGRRKKREATPDCGDAKLKPSHSFGNVCNGMLSSDEETNDGLRSSSYGMGTRAFSHDSIFILDGRAESEESVQAMSQDNILGKVKTLQQQLAKNIKFGQPPQMTVSVKTTGETNASLEAEVLLSSPMETETQQDLALPDDYNKSGGTPDSLSPASLRRTRHEVEEKVTPIKSSRPKRHHSSGTIETVNLDAIPPVIARLDNSAAKHKLSVKPKNQRVSKKHRRLSKEPQSVTEFEQRITKTRSYEVSKENGHHVEDKPMRDTEDSEKREEKRKQQDYWQNLEPAQKVQMAEVEVKNHQEHKRLQEIQREKEGKKQKLQEMEHFQKTEDKKGPEEKPRHKEQVCIHKGLEEQRTGEGFQGWQEPMQQKGQRHHEMEAQKTHEEQKPREGEKSCELVRQRQQGEASHPKLEESKQREEQRHHMPEEQRDQELAGQECQGSTESKGTEEYGNQELEEKNLYEKLLQQDWEEKRPSLEKQTQHRQHEELERLKNRKLEEHAHETGAWDAPNQQVLPLQKREVGQRQQEEEKNRNVGGDGKLQGKGIAGQLEARKRAEEPLLLLVQERKSHDAQTQQEAEKQMKPAAHGKCEVLQLKQLLSEKRVPQEDFVERKGAHQLEGQKSPSSEGQQPLENLQEQDKSFQLTLDTHLPTEEEHLETVDLPVKERPSLQKARHPEGELKDGETLSHSQARHVDVQDQERILGEELRWQEVDARQNMPRGFTFQVSSGEKQIIFQKVNLSPVTPAKEAHAPSASKEVTPPQPSKGAHALPSSRCVPHTAILVTGAQLCGTAVNLNQIKDTACKSLLGLTEERKVTDVVPTENAPKLLPDAKLSGSKPKATQDPLSNQAILAEWATIRSKILKGAETGKVNEKDRGSVSRHSDDWTPAGRGTSHSNLRKTLSANAKFSITPAWQKFSETAKTNVDADNKLGPESENPAKQLSSFPDVNQEAVPVEGPLCKLNTLGVPVGKIKVCHEVADRTEGCKFAKDLPSFLVPGVPHSPGKETLQSETVESQHNVGVRKADRGTPNGEETVAPFGVKLRRTNYSVRFSYDQQAEQKKKKRYSAGDSFEGVPTPLVTPESEKDANNIFLKESKSLSQEKKEAVVHSAKDIPANVNQNYTTAAPVCLPVSTQVAAPSQEKPACKSPLLQKPALAPKPTSQTPPSSPLSKMRRSHLIESAGQRVAKAEPDACWRRAEMKGSSLLSQTYEESKNGEEESREKKSFFPSITMPWREKNEKKPEPLKRERPVLQSRHSIDGSKLMEKVESAQPLWITLALQKQKGFREQQATREERKQAREAKQAEKLAKENASINIQTGNRSSSISRINSQPKSTPQEEEKKVETAMSRLEHREQLKKSNTLPTSVTVEISDSLPSSPLAKEVVKRFSTPDTNPVSTEPAWLALAKRKAKAWSDCPQIIK